MPDCPFDELEASRRLGVSKATLTRERLAGRVRPMRIGQRVIRYTDEILDEYRRRCPDNLDEAVAKARAGRVALIREPGVYFLFDGDEIVYVGQTGNFSARLANHMFRKTFTHHSFMASPANGLDELEARLIDKLRPRLNVMNNPDGRTSRRAG